MNHFCAAAFNTTENDQDLLRMCFLTGTMLSAIHILTFLQMSKLRHVLRAQRPPRLPGPTGLPASGLRLCSQSARQATHPLGLEFPASTFKASSCAQQGRPPCSTLCSRLFALQDGAPVTCPWGSPDSPHTWACF